jgi:hypothetical protein
MGIYFLTLPGSECIGFVPHSFQAQYPAPKPQRKVFFVCLPVFRRSLELVQYRRITNNGSGITCTEQLSNAAQRFFRAIPQP